MTLRSDPVFVSMCAVWPTSREASTKAVKIIARVHARGHSRTGASIGTLPYMAPEQRPDPREVRPAPDMYAWAVLVAWVRTGVASGELYVPERLNWERAKLRSMHAREGARGGDALFEVRRRVGETAIRLSLSAERIEVRGG